jgi:hypothetical protein
MKRAVSAGVFGLGVLGGLWGCLAYARAMFVVGDNDSPQEVLALTLALATPLPACIAALWKRLMPGIWLIFAGCFFTYGMLAERAYMIDVRHFSDEPTVARTIKFSLPCSLVLAALGVGRTARASTLLSESGD